MCRLGKAKNIQYRFSLESRVSARAPDPLNTSVPWFTFFKLEPCVLRELYITTQGVRRRLWFFLPLSGYDRLLVGARKWSRESRKKVNVLFFYFVLNFWVSLLIRFCKKFKLVKVLFILSKFFVVLQWIVRAHIHSYQISLERKRAANCVVVIISNIVIRLSSPSPSSSS